MIDWFATIRNLNEYPVKAGLAAPEEFPWSSARPIDNRPQVDNLPHLKMQPVAYFRLKRSHIT